MYGTHAIGGPRRFRDVVQNGRAYAASFGTGGSLVAGAALLFVLASALVAFNGWPALGTTPGPGSLFVPASSRAAASPAVTRLVALGARSGVAGGPAATRHAGPTAGGSRPDHPGRPSGKVPGSGDRTPGGGTPATPGGPSLTSGSPISGLPVGAGTANNVTQSATSALSQTTGSVANTLKGATNTIGSTITGVSSTAGSTVTGTLNSVGSTVSSVNPTLGGTISQTGTTAGSTVGGVGGTAGNTVTNVGNTVGNVVGGLGH